MVVAGQQNLATANEYFFRNANLSGADREQTAERTRIGKSVRQKSAFNASLKIGIAVAALIIINLVVQAMVIQKNYELGSLQSKIGDLKRQMVETRIEMARLESFDRIQEIAQSKLGMKIAGTEDYRYIAAAPQIKTADGAYAKRAEPAPKVNLWSKVNSWIADSGATMAQNQ